MPSGKVKWFDAKKGYGCITDDETQKDIFLHVSALEDSKLRVLKEDQTIVFDIKEEKVTITHTLTSMLCPMADQIQKDIKEAVERVAGEGNVKVILTHTPPFSRDMLSEEAKLILNM